MDQDYGAEQISAMTGNMVLFAYDLQKINDYIIQELTKQQLDAAEAFMTVGSKQFKIMIDTVNISKVFLTQLDIAAHLNRMMMENTHRTMSILTRGQQELTELIEKNFTNLDNKVQANQE